MTRTICSQVSTRLFLFSSTAELSFSSSASSYLPGSLPLSSLCLSLAVYLLLFLHSVSPTDDEAGREVRMLVEERIIADLPHILLLSCISSLRFVLLF